jgi:hypothetical protein
MENGEAKKKKRPDRNGGADMPFSQLSPGRTASDLWESGIEEGPLVETAGYEGRKSWSSILASTPHTNWSQF